MFEAFWHSALCRSLILPVTGFTTTTSCISMRKKKKPSPIVMNNAESLCNSIFLNTYHHLNTLTWSYIFLNVNRLELLTFLKSFWVLLLGFSQVKLLMFPPFSSRRMVSTLHIFHILKDILYHFLYMSHPPPSTPPSHTTGHQKTNMKFSHTTKGRIWNRNRILKLELCK